MYEGLTGKRRPAEDVYTERYGNEINMAVTRWSTGITKLAHHPSLRAFHAFLHHSNTSGVFLYIVAVEKTHDREE